MTSAVSKTGEILLRLGDNGQWQQAVEMFGRTEAQLKSHYRALKARRAWDEAERQRLAEPKPESARATVPMNWTLPSPVKDACKVAGIDPSHLRDRNRKKVLAHPRQHVMYLLHLRGWSYPKIGAVLGLDHTTVLHGVKAHAARANSEQGRDVA
jgi:chromosomal replication initiation ATPase DnaA